MSCEYILDLINYGPVPAPPTQQDKDLRGDAYFQAKLREHDLAKIGNDTKKGFFLSVQRFVKSQAPLPGLARSAVGDPSTKNVDGGLKLDSTTPGLNDDVKARFLTICGLLLADSQHDALTGKNPTMLAVAAGDVIEDPNKLAVDDAPYPVSTSAAFVAAMTQALVHYNAYETLYHAVYKRLRDKSRVGAGNAADSRFKAQQIAAIGRRLLADKVDPTDSQFGSFFDRALAQSLAGASDGRQSSIDIDLPDLEAGTEADIIGDNVMALSAIYFAAMLEELKFFSVMDKVVEQFMSGMLPVKRSSAGDPLYQYHRAATTRINEYERRGLYARSFGVAQGSVDEPLPNREFNDLWFRFLGAVSRYGREKDAKSYIAQTVSQEQVFKGARDLAVNLSYHGYGLAHFAAVELQELVKLIKDALSTPDVLAAYGVRDVWQLVERVSNAYLGGNANSVRQRTMATSGSQIIRWLSQKAPSLVGPVGQLIIDDAVISHVERWLAVTGTPDQATEKYSEPVALTSQRTIPDFGLPSGAASDAIRDVMSQVQIPTTPQN